MSLLSSASQHFSPLNDSPGGQNVLLVSSWLECVPAPWLSVEADPDSEGWKQKISSGWRFLGPVAGISEGLSRAAPPLATSSPRDSILVVALEENRDQNTQGMLLAASHLMSSATYGH